MTTNTIPADRAYAIRTNYERVEASHRAFGVHDTKGREFGYRVAINRVRWDAPTDKTRWPSIVPAAWIGTDTYVVEPHALRDGSSFGAIPVRSRQVFFTLEEAQAWAIKLFAAAEKRAHRHPEVVA